MMAGYGAAASERGDAQVSGGTCGETIPDRYARTETGTPRWADDAVRRRDTRCRRTGQEADSPLEVILTAGGADRGDGNNSFLTISNRA